VRGLELRNAKQWWEWTKSPDRPIDMPVSPYQAYRDQGFRGMRDWLGAEPPDRKSSRWRGFEEAREYARELGFATSAEWRAWTKSDARPRDIPAKPDTVYEGFGWMSWGDWLSPESRGGRKRGWRSFKDARDYVQTLGLKSGAEWHTWIRSGDCPPDIPFSPNVAYRDLGWKSWGDWLGTGTIAYAERGYRSFDDARRFVHTLKLRTREDWVTWAKSPLRPPDIPSSAGEVYKGKGWRTWSDWLGTEPPLNRDRVYRPFAEARDYVRNIGLSNQQEWNRWVGSPDRPPDIPSRPERVYRNHGWRNLGDWLGTGAVARRDLIYRPFGEAREFARELGLRTQTEWNSWAASQARPPDVPADPRKVYGNNGWKSMGDWLGTGTIANFDLEFLPFEGAREFVRNLHLKSRADWQAWAKSGARPSDIPASPVKTYANQGWRGMGDWLGTGTLRTQDRIYRPFTEARDFAHQLNMQNSDEWRVWSKTLDRPTDIPATPDHVYSEWQGWGDWLGTGNIHNRERVYRAFEEARDFVRNLGLQGRDEWIEWANSGERPQDIPVYPGGYYRYRGWQGWGDWLGFVGRWTRNAILSFLRSLAPVLPALDPAELYTIVRQNGLLTASKEHNNTNRHLIQAIVAMASSEDAEAAIEIIADEIEGFVGSAHADDGRALRDVEDSSQEIIDVVVVPNDGDPPELPSLRATDVLRAADQIKVLCPSADEEAVEFFIAKAVGKIWRRVLAEGTFVDIDELRAYPAGEYAQIVRMRFLQQFEGAQNLPVPIGYQFRAGNQIVSPNLMQRLIAYRLESEHRIGNWSGTGAGKTMAAILASRVTDAHLTIVVGLNNTLDGWKKEILNTFPESIVVIKERGSVTVDPHARTYLLLNFEAFQQPDSSTMVERLIAHHRVDMIVLDEVHSVKQRNTVASKRRRVLGGLLTLTAERNPGLRVLGMSATPVVNNLSEAVSLLEMVKGIRYPELKTRPTIPNIIAVHEKLVTDGVRYIPEYKQALSERTIDVPGDHLIVDLKRVGKGDVLGIEQILLTAKLNAIVAEARPGTLIYSHYVDKIVPMLRVALEEAGFDVAEFTGTNKSGLERFKQGKADILIGSSTLGTGVDGLQHVCNRLIIATLPWTSAGYEQLIGRVYRQGSAFAHVDVIVPQVVLRTGDDLWSWDMQRRDRIVFKRTLADAAVDGVIPEGVLESESAMLGRAVEALNAWIARLESEDSLRIIERERLVIPLPQDDKRRAQRRFGDFATMNARFANAKSSTTHTRLQSDPSEWYLYHTLYRESRTTWAEVPYEVLIDWLKQRPHLVVGDFGCGEAIIAQSVQNKVHSFDHVAIDDTVIACDMAHTPLEEGTLDLAIFSLSLMGTNVEDYIREAYRTLKLEGRLKIAEVAGHWQGEKLVELVRMIGDSGFELIGTVDQLGPFIYIDALKI
jgi:superfamily II DNA or RNA helicase